MQADPLVYTIFLIFTGAAVAATTALFARQALPVAYILMGMAFGPWGLGLVADTALIKDISNIGIIFLLFLLGLDLPIRKFMQLLGESTLVTGISSALFAALGFAVAAAFGYSLVEQFVIGATLMFSSTIIGLKLLPTTVLHHRHTGEIIISILLLQDLLAIAILLVLESVGLGEISALRMLLLALSLPGLMLLAYVLEKYILTRLIRRFDTIQEYIFLLAIGWCLGFAELAWLLGLSHEIGAFVAGVALAASPIAPFISESLKPLRDFFLIIFFFALGAGFDINILEVVFVPALIIALLSLLFKPLVFSLLLRRSGEDRDKALEVGVRLGQISEFSLLIAVLAYEQHVIGREAAYLIQAATLLTFILSSYFIVLRYPTPIAVSERLRRN